MKKGETIQKLLLFAAMSAGALLVAEGYLRARAFVDQVNAASHEIALLKHEVESLRVQVDVTPRPAGQQSPEPLALAQVQPQPYVLPIPEPMRFPAAPQVRQQKQVHTNAIAAAAVADEPEKADAVPDDGKVVLMKETKAAAAPAAQVATPTVDVKLWAKK